MSTPNQLEDAILYKLVHTQFFLELDFFQPKVKFWKDRSKARLEGGSGFPTSSLLPAWDPPRRRYAEEHDKLIVRLSHLLGSAGRHKRVDLQCPPLRLCYSVGSVASNQITETT